jgi:hypothetical protein
LLLLLLVTLVPLLLLLRSRNGASRALPALKPWLRLLLLLLP